MGQDEEVAKQPGLIHGSCGPRRKAVMLVAKVWQVFVLDAVAGGPRAANWAGIGESVVQRGDTRCVLFPKKGGYRRGWWGWGVHSQGVLGG